MSITIKVTKEDIQLGQRCNSSHCPVALACKRQIGKDWSETYHSLKEVRTYIFDEQPILTQFFTSFDKGLTVEPFEFELPDYVKD